MWLLFSELGDSEDRETGKDQNPGVNSSQVHYSLESLAGDHESVAVEGAGWGGKNSYLSQAPGDAVVLI